MNELKPCPFCGGEAKTIISEGGDYTEDLYWIVCKCCEAETSTYYTDEDATEAWNRRVDNGA